MKPYYEHGGIQIFHADCREWLSMAPVCLRIPLLVTDPPYPGYENDHKFEGLEEFLERIPADIKLVFWPPVYPPPFVADAEHVWVKPNWSSGQQYERIISRGAGKRSWAFRVAAILPNYDQYRSECLPHPNQKPIKLLCHLLSLHPAEAVFDPFCGSGTTLEAAKRLGRHAIGIEIEEKYCEIAAKRLSQEVFQW